MKNKKKKGTTIDFNLLEECINTSMNEHFLQIALESNIDTTNSTEIENLIFQLNTEIMASCPENYSLAMKSVENVTKNQSFKGKVKQAYNRGFLELELVSPDSKTMKGIIFNYFPNANEKIDSILMNKDSYFIFEYKRVYILDLEMQKFVNHYEITKILDDK